MQRTIFMLMPLVFVFVIARFPAGLVLYWCTTNLWTVGQGLITRRLVPKMPAPTFERTFRKPLGRVFEVWVTEWLVFLRVVK